MLGGKNKQLNRPLGYTIIEVMIVLAVSGVMFLIAANFINGKQEKTAFTEGVNDTASKIQDVIEQVTDGQYSDVPLTCTYTTAGGTQIISGSGSTQGTNAQCAFWGKIMYFTDGSPTSSSYDIFSLAGGRVNDSTNPPTIITDPKKAYIQAVHDLNVQQTVDQQLQVSKMTVNGTSAYNIGFMQNPATSGGSLASGSETVNMYYVWWFGAPNGLSQSQVESNINQYGGKWGNWFLTPAQTADICLTDGTQYADLILGTNNNRLSVDIKRDGTTKPPTC